MKCLHIILFALVSLVALPVSILAQTVESSMYEKASCPFVVPEGVVEGNDLICGYATVPEQHAEPNAPTLRLPVVIFPSTATEPAPDPLVLNAGGPGESNIDAFVDSVAGEVGRPILAQRDVVVIQIRGTRYAEPNLQCAETASFKISAISKNLSDAESTTLQLKAIKACHDRLVADGVNLAAFNSIESANDIAFITAGLGYEQFNLYGNSAGTLLTQHIMREYPDRLHSVIMGSILPLALPDVSFMPAIASETLQALLTRCADSENCAAAFPNLAANLLQLFERLDTNPVTIALQNPSNNESYEFLLTGNRLAQWLFAVMYNTNLPGQLPLALDRIISGDYGPIEEQPGFFLPDSSFSIGFQYSVFCSEHAAYDPNVILTGGSYPSFQQAVSSLWFGTEILPAACQIWDIPTLDNFVDEPVHTNVPTLLLSGEFDHVTPPRFAESVAENLQNTYAYTFPGIAHSPLDGGTCPASIAVSFLDDPSVAPNATCINEMSLRFVTEPFAIRLTAQEPPWTHLLLSLASVLLMVAALIVSVIGKMHTKDQQLASTNEQNVRRFTVIAIVPNLVYLTVFFASNPLEIIYGFPLILRITQWLPLISILPTAIALYFGVRAALDNSRYIAENKFQALAVAAPAVFIEELWWWYLLPWS